MTKNGAHFNNNAISKLEKEWNDVETDAMKLKGTHWESDYKQGWDAAVKNQQFARMAQSHENFKNSPAGQKLKKEVDDLVKALKSHVKVSDMPKQEALDEDDKYFDIEDEIELIRVQVSKAGQQKIVKEGQDVSDAWKEIEHSQPVSNV